VIKVTDVQRCIMKKCLLLCVMIVGTFFTFASANGADWIFFGKSNVGTAYYDMAGIEQLSNDVIRVSVKYAYSSEGVRAFREAFPNVNASEQVSYSVYMYEINCSAGSFMLLKATTYDPSENVIKGTDLDLKKTEDFTPEHITPNSLMELLSYATCKWRLHDR